MAVKQLPGVYAPDGSLYITLTDGDGNLASAGGGGTGSPGGSNTQVQFNDSGDFGGISGATTDGTTLTLVAPILGTPASVTLTNATGLPISTGISGLATGVATFLATPSSANLATAVTNETGTGSLVFANTPTLVTPVLGVSTGTSLALGGATVGSNALAVTGTAQFNTALIGSSGTLGGYLVETGAGSWSVTEADVPSNRYATLGFMGGAAGFRTTSTGSFQWSSSATNSTSSADLFLIRDAANTLAQRNGATAQTFNIYNTYTDASNYERAGLGWGSNVFFVGTSALGTGTFRATRLFGNGVQIADAAATTVRWTFASNGQFSNSGITLGDQAQVFAITATQPASPTGTQNAITAAITSAGSASQSSTAIRVDYLAGYTGASYTNGLFVKSAVAGTGAAFVPEDNNGLAAANYALSGEMNVTTTGSNFGAVGFAYGGNTNVGVLGAAPVNKVSATAIGVIGVAGTHGAASAVMVGGFFSLLNTAATKPTVSAALIADNSGATDPIFLARDNGTTVFTIFDGGKLVASARIESSADLYRTSTAIVDATGYRVVRTKGFHFADSTGDPTVTAAATIQYGGAAGVITLGNADTITDFARLQFGGTTSSFPAIKRSTTTLQARLADDSAFCPIQGKLTTDTAYTAGALVPTGYLTLYDSTGTAYRVPCIV